MLFLTEIIRTVNHPQLMYLIRLHLPIPVEVFILSQMALLVCINFGTAPLMAIVLIQQEHLRIFAVHYLELGPKPLDVGLN